MLGEKRVEREDWEEEEEEEERAGGSGGRAENKRD